MFVYRDRMFGNVPGLGDAELFATGPDEFTVRFQSGVRVSFARNELGAVHSARIDLGGGRTIAGERAP